MVGNSSSAEVTVYVDHEALSPAFVLNSSTTDELYFLIALERVRDVVLHFKGTAVGGGYCAGIAVEEAPYQAWPSNTSAEETTVYLRQDSCFTIENLGSGKMLNVAGSSGKSGANVTIYEADGTDGQNFFIIPNGAEGFQLQPQCTPSCALNVYGLHSAAGINVIIWNVTGHSTQSWVFEYNSVWDGYVLRSADNRDYVLTAAGSADGSYVDLEPYDPDNLYQIWTSTAFSIGLSPALSQSIRR